MHGRLTLHLRVSPGSRAQGMGVRGAAHLRSSPTCRISHSILVSSIALRPKGHSCLSSRLLFSRTIYRGGEGVREGEGRQATGRPWGAAGPSLYPDVGVLVEFRQVQHVVQGQHPGRSLGEVHRGVDVVLGKERRLTQGPAVSPCGGSLGGTSDRPCTTPAPAEALSRTISTTRAWAPGHWAEADLSGIPRAYNTAGC